MKAPTLSRRANSLPAHTLELLSGSLQDLHLLQPPDEAKVATSAILSDARSPPTVATFSPVFDLELGGSCTATSHDRPQRGPSTYDPLRRGAAAAHVAFRQPAAPLPAATLWQTLSAQKVAAAPATCSGLDRSQSDLQVMLAHRNGVPPHGAEALTPAGERLMELCKPATDLEQELARRLRAFRNARIAKPHAAAEATVGAGGLLSGPGPSSGSSDRPITAAQAADATAARVSASFPTPGEIEALASELQSQGFIVQILDGTRLSKDARSCLRTLKHRFLVCLGWGKPPQRRSLPEQQARCSEKQDAEARARERLTAPLVVEARFREQFLIASPSRAYEHLLLALPVVFVGPMQRLEGAIDLVAAEVAALFKQANRSLPPWRTKGAMLSKWAPAQLKEMERMLQQAELPGLRECDKSWGSGIGEPSLPSCAAAAGSEPLEEPTGAPPHGPEEVYGFADVHVDDSEPHGLDEVVGVEGEPAQRSSSAPPRPLKPPPADATAGATDAFLGPDVDVRPLVMMDTQLVCDARSSISQVEAPCDGAVLLTGLGPGAGMRDVWSGPSGGPSDAVTAMTAELCGGLTFQVLPEVVKAPDAAEAPLLLGPMAPPKQPQRPELQQQQQPAVLPSLQQLAPRSAFSPFACISVPEGDGGEDDASMFACSGFATAVVPTKAELQQQQGCDGGGGSMMPEFTLMHSALAPQHRMYQQDCDLGHRDAAGETWRGPTLPLPTPPTPMGLILEHQPLATGALGLDRCLGGLGMAGGATTPAAANPGAALTPSASHPPPDTAGGGGYQLQFPKADVFRITRRSSSDMSRAASKVKSATSLLATALRRATGGVGRNAAALPGGSSSLQGGNPSTSSGGSSSGTQEQAQRDDVVRDNRERAEVATASGGGGASRGPVSSGTAGAGKATTAGATAADAGAGAGGSTQVALPGGVMTRPSGDEPVWARIATVKWGQPAAGAAPLRDK